MMALGLKYVTEPGRQSPFIPDWWSDLVITYVINEIYTVDVDAELAFKQATAAAAEAAGDPNRAYIKSAANPGTIGMFVQGVRDGSPYPSQVLGAAVTLLPTMTLYEVYYDIDDLLQTMHGPGGYCMYGRVRALRVERIVTNLTIGPWDDYVMEEL